MGTVSFYESVHKISIAKLSTSRSWAEFASFSSSPTRSWATHSTDCLRVGYQLLNWALPNSVKACIARILSFRCFQSRKGFDIERNGRRFQIIISIIFFHRSSRLALLLPGGRPKEGSTSFRYFCPAWSRLKLNTLNGVLTNPLYWAPQLIPDCYGA